MESGSENARVGAWAPFVVVFLIALGLRLVYLMEIRTSPLLHITMLDAESYDAWAQRLAAGDWLGKETFYQAPLYPYFLGVVYELIGHSLMGARLVQALIGSCSCLLLALAGTRMFSRGAGIVAGLSMAVLPLAIFFDGLIQKTVLDVFLMSLALYVIGRLMDAPRWGEALALGATLGCFALTRENALLLIPLMLVWLIVQFRPAPRAARLTWCAALCLGAAIVLVPVGIRNRVVGGEFILTTSQLGPNFYMGNNERANGILEPLRKGRDNPRYERIDATDLAQAAAGRSLTPREVSRYWLSRGMDFVRAHPGRWLKLMWQKWMLVWNAVEVTDGEGVEIYSEYSRLLRMLAPLLHFGVLAPLGIAGAVAFWPQRRRIWILYAVILVFSASVAVFYVFGRYRFALAPPLTLLASAGLMALFPAIRLRDWKSIAGPAIALFLSAVLINWPMELLRRFEPLPLALSNLGAALGEKNDYAQAEALLRRARSLNPKDAGACQNLGWVLLRQDRLDEAIAEFQRALELDPGFAAAQYQWGRGLLEHGRPAESLVHLQAAVQLSPEEAGAHKALGVAFGDLKWSEEAVAEFAEAARLAPDDPEISFDLAIALSRSGRSEEAIRCLIRCVRADPAFARAQTLFDKMTAAPPRAEIALDVLKDALRESPGDKILLDLERRAAAASARSN